MSDYRRRFDSARDPLTARNSLGITAATSTSGGLVEFATDAEALALTATDKAVTPGNLGALNSSATQEGLVELATTAEMQTGTDTARVPPVSAVRDGTGAGWASFSAWKGTDQASVTSGLATQITFATEVYDTGANFTSSAWTPPAGKVSMSAGYQASGTITAGALAVIYIYKDGALFRQGPGVSSTNVVLAHISIDDNATGTSAYSVYAYVTTSAGSATITGSTAQQTYFMGHMIN